MHPWNQPILDAFESRLARLPHALLIHGPRGVGKLAFAERLAQRLLCEAPGKTKRPCGTCDPCRWFLAGNHPDFRRLEPEALMKELPEGFGDESSGGRAKKPSIVIKIDQVREMASFVNVKSSRGAMRVALVHPADSFQRDAVSAMLKNLEEPPPGAVFLLVSHRPALLPATIRSRCVALPVPIPPRDSALSWLAGQGVKDAERWLAYAGGAPLRALEYAADAETLTAILESPAPIDDRDKLERLAEALQKTALDKALSAFGLPSRYQTGGKPGRAQDAHAWLAFAREMGRNRLLTAHTLNPRLFSADMLIGRPKT
jgi:DNA polymerase-3 subunit delta'